MIRRIQWGIKFGCATWRITMCLCALVHIILVRDYAERAICYIARPSVCPSVTRVGQSKTIEVRIMQFSPYNRAILLCGISFIQKFWRVPPEQGRQAKMGWDNKVFSSFMRQYLENGTRYVQSILMTNSKLHMRFRLAPRLMTFTLNCYKSGFF